MLLAFTFHVSRNDHRWHIRHMVPNFIAEMLRTPRFFGVKLVVSVVAYDLGSVYQSDLKEAWADFPGDVYLSMGSNAGIRRHVTLYRAENSIAPLRYLEQVGVRPDYVVQLSTQSLFKKDSVNDLIDTAVRMSKVPTIGITNCYSRMISGGLRNSIREVITWGQQFEGAMVCKNIGLTDPNFNFYVHKSIGVHDKMYLVDRAILYGVMREGYMLAERGVVGIDHWKPIAPKKDPVQISNPFGRVRGDNWTNSGCKGWSGAFDCAHFADIIEFDSWPQNYYYIQDRKLLPSFLDTYKEKSAALKKSVA